jgi:hypothetical protein
MPKTKPGKATIHACQFSNKATSMSPLMSPKYFRYTYVIAHNIALCSVASIFHHSLASSTAQQLSQLYPPIVVAIFFTIMANHLHLLDNALKSAYEQDFDWSLFPPNLRQVSQL